MGLGDTLRTGLAEVFGLGDAVDALREAGGDAKLLQRAIEDSTWNNLSQDNSNYFDPRRDAREKIIERAYRYRFGDPLIKRAVELRGQYVFSKGVPKPRYRADKAMGDADDDETGEEQKRADDLISRFWCHDAETETLTTEGWMDLKTIKDRWGAGTMPNVAAFDPDTGEIRYVAALALNVQRYDGELVDMDSGRGPAFRVTPNHRMIVEANPQKHDRRWTIRRADELRVIERAPLTSVHRAPRIDTFVLPPVLMHRKSAARRVRANERRERVLASLATGASAADVATNEGIGVEQVRSIQQDLRLAAKAVASKAMHPELHLPMDAWLTWLGWYIAEGKIEKAQVSQATSSDRLVDIARACVELGVAGVSSTEHRPKQQSDAWLWSPRPNKQFRKWLHKHVGTTTASKRIPDFVFGLDGSQALHLLRGLMGGDGTPTNWEMRGTGVFYTTSRDLANDVQRLALHVGWAARVALNSRQRNPRHSQEWHVTLTHRDRAGLSYERRAPMTRKRVSYRGEVYCFATPLKTLITRRRGGVGISGNCWPENKLALTGHQAQKEKHQELILQGNVYLLMFRQEGQPDDEQLGFQSEYLTDKRPTTVLADLPAREIVEVITHPDNKKIPVYYKRVYVPRVYDFTGNWDLGSGHYDTANPKVAYYRDFRFDAPTEWNGKPWGPPADQIAEGKIYHVAINKTSDMRFGDPDLRAVLQYSQGLHTFLTSRMQIVQAIAAIALQAKTKGGPAAVAQVASALRNIQKLGNSIGNADTPPSPGHHGEHWLRRGDEGRTKVAITGQNVELQPMVTDTGSGSAQADANLLKSSVATGTGVPSTHLGGEPAPLGAGTNMEFPLLRMCESDQELWETVFRETAGYMLEGEGLDPERVEVTMPPILNRDANQLASTLAQLMGALDPNGSNQHLRRFVLSEVLDAMGKVNTRELVDHLLPTDGETPYDQRQQEMEMQLQAAQGRQIPDGQTGGRYEPRRTQTQLGAAGVQDTVNQGEIAANAGRRRGAYRSAGGPGDAGGAARDRAAARRDLQLNAREAEWIDTVFDDADMPEELREAALDAIGVLADAFEEGRLTADHYDSVSLIPALVDA